MKHYPDDLNEDLLQFIWQNKYLLFQTLVCAGGQPLQVIHPGSLNRNAGPDFFNAKLRIGNTLWAGNVEVHIKSSDWLRHKHQHDVAYRNVILHVVWEHDVPIYNEMNQEIPVLEMKNLLTDLLLEKYEILMLSDQEIPCSKIIEPIAPEIMGMWLARLSAERLEKKYLQIMDQFKSLHGHWEEVLYTQLAICFGQKTNAAPFEMLSRNLAYTDWIKYRDRPLSFQAMILGIAGFLGKEVFHEYNQNLKREYGYLQRKHALQSMDVSLWKYGKTRPANFPVIRLFQFAALIHQGPQLFQKCLSAGNYKELHQLFQLNEIQLADTGDLHPKNKESHLEKIQLSSSLIDSLLLNAVVPVVFSFGKWAQKESLCEKALTWLQEIPAEVNHITRLFEPLGIQCKFANESQALIQLKNYYCSQNKCLQCTIGNQLLKKEIVPQF